MTVLTAANSAAAVALRFSVLAMLNMVLILWRNGWLAGEGWGLCDQRLRGYEDQHESADGCESGGGCCGGDGEHDDDP